MSTGAFLEAEAWVHSKERDPPYGCGTVITVPAVTKYRASSSTGPGEVAHSVGGGGKVKQVALVWGVEIGDVRDVTKLRAHEVDSLDQSTRILGAQQRVSSRE